MGWGDCGQDSRGRNIGYAFSARCDHPGCHRRIHRGLSYACGDMHGDDEISCEGYFCSEHRANYLENEDGDLHNICDACFKAARKSGYWKYDRMEGILVPKKK